MGDAIPAITLWEPWGTLVSEGVKPYEFRSWPAPQRFIGRRIAIHAGARPAKRNEIADLVCRLQQPTWRETGLNDRDRALSLLEPLVSAPGRLPRSSVLCTAVLGVPIRNEELAAQLGIPWTNDSDRKEHSNWGWPLTDVQRLVPFAPASGKQGFWMWTPADA